jgi:hypothetical protein
MMQVGAGCRKVKVMLVRKDGKQMLLRGRSHHFPQIVRDLI